MIQITIIVVACCLISSFMTAALSMGWYNAKFRYLEKFYREDIEERVSEALVLARRRELADARRENMPRSDAGQPAVVRPAFSRIPPRKP